MRKLRIGIVDTMFARADMGSLAAKTVKDYCVENSCSVEIIRRTVPGVKDIPVEAKRLLEKEKCDTAIVLGMPGKMPVDKTCAHEASQGIMLVQLLTNKHVLEVFVHEDEAENDSELASIMRNRTIKHAVNAVDMLIAPERLSEKTGTGERQGKENASSFRL